MKKTKIVCTIGPSTDDENIMRELMKNGMDVARFNFSHSDHSVHKARFETVCKLREELGVNIATLLDTKGPEVRLKNFKDHKPVTIKDGDTFTLTTREVEGDETICSITFPQLPKDVSVGTRILINDGNIELKALRVDNTDIVCEVIHGGVVSDHKGINVPDVNLSMPYISDADMSDLEFGAKMGFDYIAASFVRTGADVIYLRKFTQSLGWFNPRIIAKIENAQGVANIDEILDAADGIMVARGDLGVEVAYEKLPGIQKRFIRRCVQSGKIAITATQMLESMITSPIPTRAEITDVANAVFDGTTAVMLSGETAAGRYPVEAVSAMAKIAVVEDNTAVREELCGFIAKYAQESGRKLDVTPFADGSQIVEPYRPGFDIIFLDIEMPRLGGMPTAERIRQLDPEVVLIFVTNMAQYAIRGYEVDALDFVLKPVSYYQFSTKLERALQRIQRRRGGQVALQVGGGVQLLDTDDILYLETRDRLLHYHTTADTWSVRGSLQKAEKDLIAYHFARCNQCYLVNLRYVKGVQDDLVLVGEQRLEISRRQRTAFLGALAAYVGGAL